MSLLMDALRRAEEAKRQANPNDHPAPSPRELSLDPLDAPTTPLRQPLPPLSRRLPAAESEPAPTTALPRPRAAATATADTASSESAERTGAKNLFAVKQLPGSRRGLWLFLGLGGMAMLVIAGYVWWQLQMMASASPTRPLPPPPAPASTQPELPAGTAQQPTPTLAEAPLPRAALESPVLAAAPRARSTPAERARRETLPPASAAGVFRPGGRQPRPDETLNLAYEAWQAGRLEEARRGYEEVLRGDTRNVDALLGLAAIATRQGQLERAQDLYLRVIDADPGNATAQAALINLRGQGNTGASESRLKTLLASQPDSSALHFALGNVYARQGRWNDAQQAYFLAYAGEPDNADYVFNVAVSLDHLRQNKLAAQYYRMALSASETGHGAFDRNAASKRILELQP